MDDGGAPRGRPHATGNRIHRHRTIQNCLEAIGHKALGSTPIDVLREPWVIRKGARDRQGNVSDGLKGDLAFHGVHPLIEKTIIDVRVFYPDYQSATTNSSSQRVGTQAREARGQERNSIEKQLAKHENEKYTKYKQACDDKGYITSSPS